MPSGTESSANFPFHAIKLRDRTDTGLSELVPQFAVYLTTSRWRTCCVSWITNIAKHLLHAVAEKMAFLDKQEKMKLEWNLFSCLLWRLQEWQHWNIFPECRASRSSMYVCHCETLPRQEKSHRTASVSHSRATEHFAKHPEDKVCVSLGALTNSNSSRRISRLSLFSELCP